VEAWIANHLVVRYARAGESADDYRKRFTDSFGSDLVIALTKDNRKHGPAREALKVWHDFVAGTDPLNEDSALTATITMPGGIPRIGWMPKWSDEEAAKRTYTTWGKAQTLSDGWEKVESGQEADYRFFRVTVELNK